MIGLCARFSRTFSLSLSLSRRAISRNGTQGPTIFRIVWFHVSVQSARSRSRVCVGGTKSDPRMHYLAHARARIQCRSTCTRAHDGRVRIVLIRVSIVYWWSEGDGVMEGNGTEKGSAPRRDIGPLSHSLSLLLPLLHPRHSFIFYFQKS